jgi:hypothetical protein
MLSVPFQRKKLTGIAEKCGNFSFNRGSPAFVRGYRGQVPDVADFNRVIRGISGEVYLGAREATIFSKRGLPRSGSQKGSNFSWP